MCGIVGYVGGRNATDLIMDGLEKLEYRGYDSAGISIIGGDKIKTVKRVGKLVNLKNALEESPLSGNVGIGHTRWATHGVPSETNAHPHLSNNEKISIVHNGIIENFLELKRELISKGYEFKSDTDTEVIVNLIDFYNQGDFTEAVLKAVGILKGQFALGIVNLAEPDRIYAIRHNAPLLLGLSDEGNFIGSDIPSFLTHTRKVIYLDNDELAVVESSRVSIYDLEKNPVIHEISIIEWDMESASKDGYDHYMLKEIYEQPSIIRNSIERRIHEGKIDLLDCEFTEDELNKIDKVFIVACGTAFHAGEVGKYFIEKFAKIPVVTQIASEFRYSAPFVDDKSLLILVSQSGETADTLAALRIGKEKGAMILSVTNVIGSSITRESDKVMYCYAGPEISVASTKAYTTQVICLCFLALKFARLKGLVDDTELQNYFNELKSIPEKIEEVLENKEEYKKIAESIKDSICAFYIGRGLDYLTAKEGALKLKEISYIYTESFPAGELKHGPIALIEDGTPIIAITTSENIAEKTISNIKELNARGANIYSIGMEGVNEENLKEVSDVTILIPKILEDLAPILSVIPAQLLAYYTSLAKGNDVDKPRNLAKSVTVE